MLCQKRFSITVSNVFMFLVCLLLFFVSKLLANFLLIGLGCRIPYAVCWTMLNCQILRQALLQGECGLYIYIFQKFLKAVIVHGLVYLNVSDKKGTFHEIKMQIKVVATKCKSNIWSFSIYIWGTTIEAILFYKAEIYHIVCVESSLQWFLSLQEIFFKVNWDVVQIKIGLKRTISYNKISVHPLPHHF